MKGVSSASFYAPGSILSAETSQLVGLPHTTVGRPGPILVYVDQPRAFEIVPPNVSHRIPLSYARGNPLRSGWLLGPEKIEGKGAIVEFKLAAEERSGVILFGFRPQHRGQTHGTFRLLFNALMLP